MLQNTLRCVELTLSGNRVNRVVNTTVSSIGRWIAGDGESVHDGEEALVAFFFYDFLKLAWHLGGEGVFALGVAEDEGVVELEVLDGIDGHLEIFFGLAGANGFHFLTNFDAFLVFVRTAHRFEDGVRAALHRELDV